MSPTMDAMVCADMVCAWCVGMVCIVHVGRGRRPRRPACLCRPRCRPRGRGAPGTSRPTMGAMVWGCGHGVCMVRVHGCGHGVRVWCVDMVCVVHVGRGRRPRRPASTMSFPMSSPWARRAGDVAPYHGCHGAGVRAWRVHGAWTWCAWCMMVGADVPGGPRACVVPDVVPDVVPVGAARRGRRALPWMPWCGGAGMVCMVGADVPGGPRPRCRPRCRPRGRGAPGTSRPPLGASTLKNNLRAFVPPRAPC